MKSDTIVIIPTYNERENIEAIIRAVTSLEKAFDILIIDAQQCDLQQGDAGEVSLD